MKKKERRMDVETADRLKSQLIKNLFPLIHDHPLQAILHFIVIRASLSLFQTFLPSSWCCFLSSFASIISIFLCDWIKEFNSATRYYAIVAAVTIVVLKEEHDKERGMKKNDDEVGGNCMIRETGKEGRECCKRKSVIMTRSRKRFDGDQLFRWNNNCPSYYCLDQIQKRGRIERDGWKTSFLALCSLSSLTIHFFFFIYFKVFLCLSARKFNNQHYLLLTDVPLM